MIEVTPAMVKAKFDERFAAFTDAERRAFRHRFIVHDYEVRPNAVLLVTLDIATGKHWKHWGCKAIKDHLRRIFLNNDSTVLVGFNNKGFDNRITDAILDGCSDAGIKALSDSLIADHGQVRWKSGDKGKYRPKWVKRTFDIGFDIGQKKIGPEGNERKIPEVSLKRWERLNDLVVKRSSLPFYLPLTTKEHYAEEEQYCLDDNCATAWLLLSDESWNPCLNARRVLVDDYGDLGVDWVMTKPMITSIVLNADEKNYDVPDDWEDEKFQLPSRLRIWKNRDIVQAYTEKTFGELRAMSCKAGGGGVIKREAFGIPHTFGVGGVHGCPEGVWESNAGGIWDIDAASLYPRMMQHYDLLSRRVIGEDRRRFGELIDLRVNVYKPNKDKRADGLKLVLNGGFGSMGFEKSEMYDPVMFNSVTILGQLLMTDLMEKLERHIVLIQSNTDGLFFTLRDNTPAGLARCVAIVKAYERRTLLEMEWMEIESMHQKDVSSYVMREVPRPGALPGTGKVTAKGSFHVKHCTATPYLILARIHAALNKGVMLSPDGIPLDRFAIESKRDKNSECFLVNGERDDREWLDVVPVPPDSKKRKKIITLCKARGSIDNGMFNDATENMALQKRRKTTNCPDFAALMEDVTVADLDLEWYKNKLGIEGMKPSSPSLFDL